MSCYVIGSDRTLVPMTGPLGNLPTQLREPQPGAGEAVSVLDRLNF